MDEDDWDPTPPHGVRGGYEKFPGYESVSGETGKPRLAPRPPAPTSGTTSGYDFKNISNSPLYQREHARSTPPY
ncbi:MAG: hypothetical protein ACMUHU_03135, partial [Thermoplasmatota archaeon]